MEEDSGRTEAEALPDEAVPQAAAEEAPADQAAAEEAPAEQASADDGGVAQGRRIFMLGAGLLVTVNLVSAFMRFSATGSFLGFIRLALLSFLLFAVWRGAGWARVIVTVLLVIGALLALVGAAGARDSALRLILLGIGGIDLAFAGALVFSAPLRAFLEREAA